MSVDCSTNLIFSFRYILFNPLATRLGSHLRHTHHAIPRSHPPRRHFPPLPSSTPPLPKPSHRRHPPEDLFDSLANPLTETITLMPSRSAIDGRTAFFGRHMRDNLSPAQKIDKIMSVITLVGTQAFYLHSFSSLTLNHFLGCFPLASASGLTVI